jgi:hypothetical protein
MNKTCISEKIPVADGDNLETEVLNRVLKNVTRFVKSSSYKEAPKESERIKTEALNRALKNVTRLVKPFEDC